MYHNGNLADEQPNIICCVVIIDLINILYFEKMISRTKRTLLSLAPLVCLVTDE